MPHGRVQSPKSEVRGGLLRTTDYGLRTTKCGLTLVELVLTVGLAGILGIPTGLLLSEHLRAAVTSRDSTVAMGLARAETEQLDSLNNFFALPLGTVTIANYQGYPYNLTRTITCQAGNCTSGSSNSQGVKRIVVTVTKAGSTAPLARMTTYRTKHVLFGL